MEVTTHLEESTEGDESNTLRRKRAREDDSSGSWTTVRREKRMARRQTSFEEIGGISREDQVEICVTNSEMFPKQFALAKLFKTNVICGISRVKYVNPYKLKITFDNETFAEKMINCKVFYDMGWRAQKSWEVGVSYGVIKDIELDLTMEEFVSNVSCDVEILSARRLDRKCRDLDNNVDNSNGWIASESIRVCFKGAFVPSHVNIYGMRAKVERYTFPVTQCSKCWRYGHVAKMCRSSKVTCPRCGGKHDRCEETTFVCVNCKGNHIALDKSCPIYIKEKKLRDLMFEFNCTYRKALMLYVPPSPPPIPQEQSTVVIEKMNTPQQNFVQQNSTQQNSTQQNTYLLQNENHSTYADKVKADDTSSRHKQSTHTERETRQKSTQHKKRRQSRPAAGVMERESDDSSIVGECEPTSSQSDLPRESSDRHKKDTTFGNLISKIMDRVLQKGTIMDKIHSVIKIIVDWLVLIVFNNMSDNSTISKLFNGAS